jgi:hypothetical protein
MGGLMSREVSLVSELPVAGWSHVCFGRGLVSVCKLGFDRDFAQTIFRLGFFLYLFFDL